SFMYYFFFSSRRRHTRSKRDWSSDVCSSDLPWIIPRALDFLVRTKARWPWDRIVSHKYPLEKINEAFAASEWHNKETTSITRARSEERRVGKECRTRRVQEE